MAMMSSTRFTLPGSADPEAELQSFLRTRWSNDLRVGAVTKLDDYTRRVSVNARRVDLIFDRARNKRIFSCHTVEDLVSFSLRLTRRRWVVEGPTLHQFLEAREKRKVGIVTQSENALIKLGYDKLVDMSMVKNALSRIENLLIWLSTEGSVPLTRWRRGGGSEQQDNNYLYILRKLEFVSVEAGLIVPGAQFGKSIAGKPPRAMYAAMLARAVQEDYHFLSQVLRLTQLVGPLHWANSYYLTAYLADRPKLALPLSQLEQRFAWYYPSGGTDFMQRRGQLMRLINESDIVKGDNHQITCDPSVAERYFDVAAKGSWQAAV